MPCHVIRDGNGIGFICRPTIEEQKVKIQRCPTCKKRRKFYAYFQEWYGWTMTCLGCGEMWADGEMLGRPFMPGWRKDNIRRAKKRIAEMKGAKQ